MAYTPINTSEVTANTPILASTGAKVKNNEDYLYDEKKKLEALMWASLTF